MENKNYYYLKLKENFFDEDEIKILESMENGYLYSNILLKLYLKALKNDGKLIFNEFIPYDSKMLATITGHNIDVIEKAIKIFQTMHLIEILDNGAIYMLNIQNMLGSISSEGIRKAEYREKIKLEKEKKGTNLGQCPNIISLSNYNSNSNYNNIYNIEEKKNKFKIPTLEEVKEYCKERQNNVNAENFIDFYTSKGWKVGKNPMKDWKACVRTWEQREKEKQQPKKQEQSEEEKRIAEYNEMVKNLYTDGFLE